MQLSNAVSESQLGRSLKMHRSEKQSKMHEKSSQINRL